MGSVAILTSLSRNPDCLRQPVEPVEPVHWRQSFTFPSSRPPSSRRPSRPPRVPGLQTKREEKSEVVNTPEVAGNQTDRVGRVGGTAQPVKQWRARPAPRAADCRAEHKVWGAGEAFCTGFVEQ